MPFEELPADHSLMQSVLKPLLEDFQHWFHRALNLLEAEPIADLSSEQQSQLHAQVKTALAEVQTAKALLQATNGQVGVEAAKVMLWHRLVHQCWSIAQHHRRAGRMGKSG